MPSCPSWQRRPTRTACAAAQPPSSTPAATTPSCTRRRAAAVRAPRRRPRAQPVCVCVCMHEGRCCRCAAERAPYLSRSLPRSRLPSAAPLCPRPCPTCRHRLLRPGAAQHRDGQGGPRWGRSYSSGERRRASGCAGASACRAAPPDASRPCLAARRWSPASRPSPLATCTSAMPRCAVQGPLAARCFQARVRCAALAAGAAAA